MTLRRTRLRVEELDARTLPSTVPLSPAHAIAATAVAGQSTPQHHPLTGQGHGNYTSDITVDVGPTYQLQGTGTVGTLGQVSIKGTVHAPGFILGGSPWGTLTFSNTKGSVTVGLTGLQRSIFVPLHAPSPNHGKPVAWTLDSHAPVVLWPNFNPVTDWFRYQVTSATGSYQHVHDQGTLRVDLRPWAVVDPPFRGADLIWAIGGSFTIHI